MLNLIERLLGPDQFVTQFFTSVGWPGWFENYSALHVLVLGFLAVLFVGSDRLGFGFLFVDAKVRDILPGLAVALMWITLLATPAMLALIRATVTGTVDPADPVLQRAVLWTAGCYVIQRWVRVDIVKAGMAYVYGILMIVAERAMG